MTSDARHDPLAELSAQGVAVWLDDLSRELLATGALQSLITSRHVVGVTTNPTIFASALSKGHRYDDQLRDLAEQGADVDTAGFAITPTTSALLVTSSLPFTSRPLARTAAYPSK
jgi:transaldolase